MVWQTLIEFALVWVGERKREGAKMDRLQKFLEDKLGPIMGVLGSNRYLLAVRDGVISALPLIIVGSFFMIVANPPLPQDWGIYKYLTANAATILLPYRVTMYIMALYAVFGMGVSLSKSYDLDGVSGGILSVMAFLLTITPVNVSSDANAGVTGFVLPMSNLGSGGLFVGIIVTFIAVNIFSFTEKSNFKITMPDQVPPAVARSFEALTPTLIVIVLIGSITYFFGFNWNSAVTTAISPLVSATDTLPGVLLICFLTCFFWFFGIHGASIVGSLARPLWLVLLEANANAAAAGTELPAISAEPFYQWFIWIGGAGCTIGLALLLVTVCKSKYLKDLGKIGVIPAIFNINEPLIFGASIVLNLTLAIPFIITPLVCAVIAWVATELGMVSRVIVTAPWTLPGPIGAFLATGGDWRAIVLSFILIAISIVIYYPFVKIYDRSFLSKEKEDESAVVTA
jgi:PTS system cellobiose-specific IIC component